MSVTIYLLRHGIAEDFDARTMKSDADRRLTQEGRDKLKRQAAAMATLDLGIRWVFCSPFVRARETAELAMQNMPGVQLEVSEALKPSSAPLTIIKLIESRGISEPTLLVGHEPHMSCLASTLLVGSLDAALEVKKASLLSFTFSQLQSPYRAELNFLLPSKVLRKVS